MSDATLTALSWAERAWGRVVAEVTPLRGGWTSTMLGLTSTDGGRAVLRLMTREPWRTHAAGLLGREAAIQGLLAATDVPAPRSIALDLGGEQAGEPAHLMSLLPGSVDLARNDEALLTKLARLLVAIHDVDPGTARPRDYQSWAPPAKRVVPEWSRQPELWKRAFSLLEEEPPTYRGTFLHRDFHVGNVLWDEGEASGVVDWVETSWGPRGLDVAHCTTHLAMLHGPGTAGRFAEVYRGLAPGSDDPCDQRYWDVMDVVGYLPDPIKVAQPWRDLGRDIADELARERLEEHLSSVLHP